MKNPKLIIRLITRLIIVTLLLSVNTAHAQLVETIFGDIDEQNPVAIELLNSRALQRLKNIDQSGPLIYFSSSFPKFSRYEHSVGVYALLKRYNVSSEEQIAGLMHDASHTVFSHLADYLFQTGTEQHSESYQDSIHEWFLTKTDVPDILRKYNLAFEDISPENPKYTALEQPYPDMNADRIEYNLHTALKFNHLNSKQVYEILDALKYKNNKWYFTDVQQATSFAKLSTLYTRTFWGSAHNAASYIVMGAAVKRALNHNIVDLAEIHFGVDSDITKKLQDSRDPMILKLLAIMIDVDNHYVVTDQKDYDIHYPVKMRGIDPLVLKDGKLRRLSSLNADFKQDLQHAADLAKQGVYLKFTSIDPKLLPVLQNIDD